MRHLHRKISIVLGTAAIACTALVLESSCTHGSYDGSYDGGSNDSGSADGGADAAGKVVLMRTLDGTKLEKLTTPDTALEITIPKGAFPAGTTITVTRQADRQIEDLVVPVYTVTAPDALLPVQVLFQGSNSTNGNGGTQTRALLVAEQAGDGSYAPSKLFGTTFVGVGGSVTTWAIVKHFATYSLVNEDASKGSSFLDIASGSCFAKCCPPSGSGNYPANGVCFGEACGCVDPPNPTCWAQSCPDIDANVARLLELAANPNSNVKCQPPGTCMGGLCPQSCNEFISIGGGSPGGSGVCCINGSLANCQTNMVCNPGIAIHCDLDTSCPDGTKCCVFEDEARCAATCPNERIWCTKQENCTPGAGDAGPASGDAGCVAAPHCPYGTCGTPPSPCR